MPATKYVLQKWSILNIIFYIYATIIADFLHTRQRRITDPKLNFKTNFYFTTSTHAIQSLNALYSIKFFVKNRFSKTITVTSYTFIIKIFQRRKFL